MADDLEWNLPTAEEFGAGIDKFSGAVDTTIEFVDKAIDIKEDIQTGMKKLSQLAGLEPPPGMPAGGRWIYVVGEGGKTTLVYYAPTHQWRGTGLMISQLPAWIPLGIGGTVAVMGGRLLELWISTRITEAQLDKIASADPFDGLPGRDPQAFSDAEKQYYIANALAIALVSQRDNPTRYSLLRSGILDNARALGLCVPSLEGDAACRGRALQPSVAQEKEALLGYYATVTGGSRTPPGMAPASTSDPASCIASGGIFENGACTAKMDTAPSVLTFYQEYKTPIWVAAAVGGAILVWSMIKPKKSGHAVRRRK
jgi:hypothetical protein